MRVVLQAAARQTVPGNGLFVFIESATGPVTLIALLANGKQTSIDLNPKDQAEFREEFQELVIVNAAGVTNTIEIKTGFARYIPKLEGGEVQITGQTVPLTVEFDTPPEVVVNGGVNATISDPVEVFTGASDLDVHIASQTVVVEVEENAPDGISDGGVQTPGTGAGYTIAANADRVYCMIRCNAANDGGPMFVNSVPLYADDPPMRVDGNMAITVVGSDADDTFYYFEVTRS